MTSPIAIFCYKRPAHLYRTLQSLIKCEGFDESSIYIFCDGPRNKSEISSVEETRNIANIVLGSRAQYFYSDNNQGLSNSIISGVNKILEISNRIIVIEDDLELDKFFLKFMNEALEKYSKYENVFQISGYMYHGEKISNHKEAFFLPLTTSWGWATWKRAWNQFDLKASGWEKLHTDIELRKSFNVNDAYDYSSMLERQMNNHIDSWAIRWYWSVFIMKGLVLYPPLTLVQNRGFDGSGTHGRGLIRRFNKSSKKIIFNYPEFPGEITIDNEIFNQVSKILHWKNGGWFAKFFDFIKRLLK